MSYFRIAEAAKQLRVSPSTVRWYANQGRLNYKLTPAGQRVFTQKHLDEFLGIEKLNDIAFYCRTSKHDPRALELQEEKLASQYGASTYTVKDTGSGLNENRKGLAKLITLAKQQKIKAIAITSKDRLTRFGFSYLQQLFAMNDVEILILDNQKEKNLEEELLQDFMSLVASFSGKFYRLRGYAQRKMLLELAQGELADGSK